MFHLYFSFIEQNISASQRYRRYNEALPLWLHNRPKKMVSHIIDRLTQSQDIKEEHISCAAIKNGVQNKFYVQSKSCGKEYLVFINDEDNYQERNLLWKKAADEEYNTVTIHHLNENLPCCECPDWKKFQLPCKHILAVFTKYNYVWNNFPSVYKNSPYFSVDFDFIDKIDHRPVQNEVVDADVVDESESIEEDVVHLLKLPKKIYPKRTIASSCRDMLKELKDLTYVVRNLDSFESLEEELSTILEAFRKEAPSDYGLLLENKPFKTKKTQETSRYGPLPIPKKLKSKFTGRVGRANEVIKLHRNIDVRTDKTKDVLTLEEPVPVNDIANYDHPIVLSDEDFECDFSVPVVPVVPVSPVAPVAPVVKKKKFETKKRKAVKEIKRKDDDEVNDSNDEVKVTEVISGAESKSEKRKIRKLELSPVEIRHITNDEMITDESIDLAQQLLTKQFPIFDGFADIALSEQNGFEPIKRNNPFVQVLNTGSLHWICVSNLKKNRESNDECVIHDSLSNGKITSNIAWKISNMLFCQENPEIRVLVESVQQQRNSIDCGLFAVAFATSLVFGSNPCNVAYDQKLMRGHFLNCLKKKVMRPFPENVIRTRILKCPPKELSIELFCICRQPYDPKQKMAECMKCQEWIHDTCGKIPSKVFTDKNYKFICISCKK